MGWLQNVFGSKRSESKIDYDRVIRSYGAVLEATANESVSDEKTLPLPPNELGPILLAAISNTAEGQFRESLKIAYVSLGKFMTLTDSEADLVDSFTAKMQTVADKKGGDPMELINLLAESGDTYIQLTGRVEHQFAKRRQELQARKLW